MRPICDKMAHRILIVEDEAELRKALVVRLEAAGYVCEQASGGEEGLVKALQQPPDLAPLPACTS